VNIKFPALPLQSTTPRQGRGTRQKLLSEPVVV